MKNKSGFTPLEKVNTIRGRSSLTGFSLIELIMAIVIISVCVSAVALMFQQAVTNGVKTRIITVASGLAEEKMEQTLALGFDNAGTIAETAFASPFSEYSYCVIAHYVQSSNFDLSVDPTVTDYKSVEIQISNANLAQPISLKSVLAKY